MKNLILIHADRHLLKKQRKILSDVRNDVPDRVGRDVLQGILNTLDEMISAHALNNEIGVDSDGDIVLTDRSVWITTDNLVTMVTRNNDFVSFRTFQLGEEGLEPCSSVCVSHDGEIL